MRFHLSAELLAALRERRVRLRTPPAGQPPKASFVEHVQELFSTANADPKRIGDEYVAAMCDWQAEIEETHDAFLLDPGMGPMLYLTADGRVLTDGRGWDGEPLREATDDEAIGAIVVGARKTGIAALLELLPERPDEAMDCPSCAGTRFTSLPMQAGSGGDSWFVCWDCKGRGWREPTS